ncbi:ribosomal-processing cysteine protease Prp [Clostridium sp. LBM24168]
MIKVEFKRKSCNLVSARLTGHADSENNGYDLVCCAVSVLSQSILIGLTEVLGLEVNYSIENGFLSFSLENMPQSDIEKCQVLMKTMLFGLKRIELSYGKYISTYVEEV